MWKELWEKYTTSTVCGIISIPIFIFVGYWVLKLSGEIFGGMFTLGAMYILYQSMVYKTEREELKQEILEEIDARQKRE